MKEKLIKLKEMHKDAGYKKQFIALFLVIESSVIIEVITIPYILKRIINIEIPNENIQGLLVWGFIYICILVLQCYMVLKHCDMRFILKKNIQRDLRQKIFNKLQQVKAKFYDDNDIGVILQFLQSDTDNAAMLFSQIMVEMYFMGLASFTIVAIFLMFVNINITLLILMLYIIGFFITLFFNKKILILIKQIRKLDIELYSYINEGVNGFLTIKTLNIIDKKEKELNDKLKEYTNASSRLEKIIAKYNNIFKFMTSFSTVIIIFFAGIDVIKGFMTYAEIILLIEYSNRLEYEFKWFIKHLTNSSKSFYAYSKILEFLKLDNIEKIEEGEELKNINNIEFKKVYFSYNSNQKNIKNFSLKINKKDKVALVGRTGSGKTTITSLLCRFYEPIKGEILINDKDYKKYSIVSLRKNIGYVSQEIQLLPNTIIDNIRYVNKNITISEIEKIFKKLKMHDKIMSLDDKYNTDIYNNPDILSTGEKQIINFARVMAIDTDVIILDEVTASLSYESEELVKNAINEITKDKICIIIAHRLSTIKECNKILVLEDGRVMEEGNYDELMKKQGKYYTLVNAYLDSTLLI